MTRLASRLPSLTALLAFEAAARHENFTRAADELGRTQSAVSRQVLALEADLGVSLFRRASQSVRLTRAGHDLLAAVTMGFDHVANAIDSLRTAGSEGTATIACSPALATFWLIPRLSEFLAAYPDADIRVSVVGDTLGDPEASDADLVFVWGKGEWPGLVSSLLARDEVLAVRSPAYKPRGPMACIDDLALERLLHLEPQRRTRGSVEWQTWLNWSTWFQALGAETEPKMSRGIHVNSFLHLIQACLGGEGIALGWRMVIEDHLNSGALVPVLNQRHTLDDAYYIAWPSERPLSDMAVTFRDWLMGKVQS